MKKKQYIAPESIELRLETSANYCLIVNSMEVDNSVGATEFDIAARRLDIWADDEE